MKTNLHSFSTDSKLICPTMKLMIYLNETVIEIWCICSNHKDLPYKDATQLLGYKCSVCGASLPPIEAMKIIAKSRKLCEG